MTKKVVQVFLISIIAFVFFANFASADVNDSLRPIVDLIGGIFSAIFEVIRPLLQVLLGGNSSYDDETFIAKILGVIIVASIVYVVVSKSMASVVGDNKWVLWIISIVVPILGFRFVSEEMMAAAVLPSSVFAVSVTAGLPFILYFFLIGDLPKAVKRIAWIFFAVMFLGLYAMRVSDGDLKGIAAAVYPIIALIALIMALIDGTIRRWIATIRHQSTKTPRNMRAVALLQNQLATIQDTYAKNIAAGAVYSGATPLGHGRTGAEAYNLDVQFYQRQIDRILYP